MPNAISADLRRQIADGLQARLHTYLANLDMIDDPADYCASYVSMAKSILPKETNLNIETARTIEDRLSELCEETDDEV